MSTDTRGRHTESIHCRSTLFSIGVWTILRIAKEASSQLPSRGLVSVEACINDVSFRTVLEPDGKGSHWLSVDKALQDSCGIQAGEAVELKLTPLTDWPEPEVPEDLEKALMLDPGVFALWKDITPLARWDWIRWIRSTQNRETRMRRIDAARDKMAKGERRPCCFNRNMCTEPEVSRSGVLLDPPKE